MLDRRADILTGAISASQKPAGRPSRPIIPQDSSDPPSASGASPVPTDPKADRKNIGAAASVNRSKPAAVGGATVNRKKAIVQEQDKTQLITAEVKSQSAALKQANQPRLTAEGATREDVHVHTAPAASTSQVRTAQQNVIRAEEPSSVDTPRATRSSSRKAVRYQSA
jgi:hypothetical protein